METLYLACAVAGGTFLGLQFVLLLVGFGGSDTDFDVGGDVGDVGDIGDAGDFDVDSGEGASGAASAHAFQVISTKTLTAFFTFFGLGGMLGAEMQLTQVPALATAIGFGLIAVFVVAYLWSMLYRLQSHGNVDVRKAVGTIGRVYLRIPPEGSGHGKVTVMIQGRTIELSATTTEDELPTGAEVKIVAFIGKATVQVVRAQSA
jgi:membrane protein implicated in regulation of membrane protease activity